MLAGGTWLARLRERAGSECELAAMQMRKIEQAVAAQMLLRAMKRSSAADMPC
jgi:hypothetical protein